MHAFPLPLNRTYVELRPKFASAVGGLIRALNRTYVELRRCQGDHSPDLIQSLNRTYVELRREMAVLFEGV